MASEVDDLIGKIHRKVENCDLSRWRAEFLQQVDSYTTAYDNMDRVQAVFDKVDDMKENYRDVVSL